MGESVKSALDIPLSAIKSVRARLLAWLKITGSADQRGIVEQHDAKCGAALPSAEYQ
jgi:hypothetical protein